MLNKYADPMGDLIKSKTQTAQPEPSASSTTTTPSPSPSSGDRVSTPNVITRAPATTSITPATETSSSRPAVRGAVLGQGKQIEAMQDDLGNLQKELVQIFESDKSLTNLMNHYDSYAIDTKATTPFLDHLRHLVGLGGAEKQQADGRWGDKTTQALFSIGGISQSLSKLSADLGAKGHELNEASTSIINLTDQAKKDPANAERKYAPEIRMELAKIQAAMGTIRQHAAEASKQLGSVFQPQKPSMVRNVDPKTGKVDPFGIQGLIDYGNDTGLIYRDQVMGNIPVSYADLKNLNTLKKHFARYLGATNTTGGLAAPDENAQLRAIVNNLMQQADQQLEQLKHPNANPAGI